MFRPRGNINFSRKPSIDPVLNHELSKIAKCIPNISYGDQFPGRRSTFGDMHFFTGEDTTSYKKNNWYIRPVDDDADWQSMNATSILAQNIQAGVIGTGVKVTDSLQLLGGEMLGLITFFKDQKFPAAQIGPGTIPNSVLLAGYVPATGGIYTGNIDMSDHYISSIQKLYGYDNDIFIDMSANGILAASSDVSMSLTSPLIQLIGALAVTGNIDLSDYYISSISKLYGYDNNIYIDMSVDGYLGFGADVGLDFFINAVKQIALTDGKLIPVTDSDIDLGDATHYFKNAYIDNLFTSGGRISAVTTVTDTYIVLVSDDTVICNKATAFTVTLPAAVIGQKFTIKNIGAGRVTIDGDGADTIDGETTQAINQWDSVQLQCYAANKWGVL